MKGRFLGLSFLLMGILELILVYIHLLGYSPNISNYLWGHGCLVLSALFLYKAKALYPGLFLRFLTLMPGVGFFIAGTYYLFITDRISDQLLDDFMDQAEGLGGDARFMPVNAQQELNEASIEGSLYHGDTDEKKHAVIHFSSDSLAVKVRVLRKALNDEDPEVIHYAASTLNHIEQELLNRITELKKELQHSSKADRLKELASLSWDYILSGYISGEVKQAYLQQYLDVIDRLEKTQGSNFDTLLQKADAKLELGNLSQAKELYLQLVEKKPAEFIPYYKQMLIAYQKQDTSLLKDIAKYCVKQKDIEIPSSHKSIIKYWASEDLPK